MLYCPKCQQTYDERTQRFCPNDGLRLLPAPSSGKSANQTGVFAKIINRADSADIEKKERFSALPKFTQNEASRTSHAAFRPPSASKIFKNEPEFAAKTETAKVETAKVETAKTENKPQAESRTPVQKPLPRIVQPNEIQISQAKLGDRRTNPTGRLALSRENTGVLLGQTVKGRYYITEKVEEDDASIAYLAEDRIVENKKVLVRVLMDEDTDDYFTDKIFAEERVSLSHFNHPNVAGVMDSGELPEGKPFIITEYVEGKSVKDMLAQTGQFNVLRAARIIRQASYALGAVHQSGILHRGLSPENIILPVSENGIEQVKLTNFGVSKGKFNKENFAYESPEQIEGRTPTAAADLYSLAVIAYQMLTNRLPFSASSVGDLLKAQREGLTLRPTNLRLDISPSVDEVLEKALAFNPSERYPKARDFGDALFNAAATTALWENDAENTEKIDINSGKDETEQNSTPEMPLLVSDLPVKTAEIGTLSPVSQSDASPNVFDEEEKNSEAGKVKAGEGLPWEKRSPELPKTAGMNWTMLTLLGAFILLSALGLGYFVSTRPNEAELVQTAAQPAAAPEQNIDNSVFRTPLPTTEEIESPPLPRTITPPPNTVFFENSKQNLKGETAKNFLGFSLYYPKDWKRNEAENKFLDISKNAPSGTPVEQMLVSYYDSKGTFKADREIFPSLVKETNSTLKTIVPNYKMVSEGEQTVNGGWKAYEVNFAGAGKTAKGEDIKLWGRRLFIPAARNGMKNGYVLTMLATSLSPDVKSIEDVGKKGDLATILETFEPNQNF